MQVRTGYTSYRITGVLELFAFWNLWTRGCGPAWGRGYLKAGSCARGAKSKMLTAGCPASSEACACSPAVSKVPLSPVSWYCPLRTMDLPSSQSALRPWICGITALPPSLHLNISPIYPLPFLLRSSGLSDFSPGLLESFLSWSLVLSPSSLFLFLV